MFKKLKKNKTYTYITNEEEVAITLPTKWKQDETMRFSYHKADSFLAIELHDTLNYDDYKDFVNKKLKLFGETYGELEVLNVLNKKRTENTYVQTFFERNQIKYTLIASLFSISNSYVKIWVIIPSKRAVKLKEEIIQICESFKEISSKKEVEVPIILKHLQEVGIDVNEIINEVIFSCSSTNSIEVGDGDLYWTPLIEEQKLIEDNFVYLARADATGGIYAFFLLNKDLPLDFQPIAFMGSEGEFGICAENIVQWLRLISIGGEIMAGNDGNLWFTAPDLDYVGAELHSYRDWLKKIGLSPYEGEIQEDGIEDKKAIEYGDKIIRKSSVYNESVYKKLPFLNRNFSN